MKNSEIINLLAKITSIQLDNFKEWDKSDARFKLLYQIAKEKNKIERIVNNIKSTLKTPPEMEEYYSKLNEINSKYANRDEKGGPKTIRVGTEQSGRYIYDIPIHLTNNPESDYNIDVRDITKQYQTFIDQYKENIAGYNTFLEQENTDYKAMTLTEDRLPKDIDQATMDILTIFIPEDPA